MSDKRFLKSSCAHCGGHIEFPAEGIGLSIACPHCTQPTELGLAVPVSTSAGPSRSLKWVFAGVIILALGIAGVAGALAMAKHLARKSQGEGSRPVVLANPHKTDSAAASVAPKAVKSAEVFDGFSSSPVTIENAPGRTLVYAVGTIKNETDKARFGVTIELGLFDSSGRRLGSARDYKDSIEPRGAWSFRALLVQKSVASARLSSVREQP